MTNAIPSFVNAFMRLHNVQPGQSYRGDCPVCGGHYRFQVYQDNREIMWNCFGSSCKARGRSSVQIRPQQLGFAQARLHGMFNPGQYIPMMFDTTARDEWDTDYNSLLNCFTQVERFDPRWEWLEARNCSDAFDACPEKFMYDKIKDRLVFIEFHERYSSRQREVTMVTGRTMSGADPKWYKYEVKETFFSSMSHDMTKSNTLEVDVFICEDPPSACSLGRVGLGVALCGTVCDTQGLHSFLESRIGLKSIRRMFICLDEDAMRKGSDLRRNLHQYRMAISQLMLTDDAKNLTLKQLKKQIPTYVYKHQYYDIDILSGRKYNIDGY